MTTPFERPTLIVASPHTVLANALRTFIELFIGEDLPYHFPTENTLSLRCVEDLYTRLDSLEPHKLLDTVCIVDLSDEYGVQWDIDKEESGLRPSSLVLRYPEVFWIFLTTQNVSDLPDCHFVDLSSFFTPIDNPSKTFKPNIGGSLLRHSRGFRTWFDPTGFRRWIREGNKNEDQRRISSYGIAIDEEVNFALLNGYVLYRNDHATFIVNSCSEMDEVLKDNRLQNVYVLEDAELKFCDATGERIKKGYLIPTEDNRSYCALLKKREEEYPLLRTATARIIVSSALIPVDTIKTSQGQAVESVIKPYGGMFAQKLEKIRVDSRNQSGYDQHQELPSRDESEAAQKNTTGDPVNSHSAPFQRQQIAESLLIRARHIEHDATSVRSAVHAALLANEARRLLHNQTLALSLEALAIQHRMEVTAECSFIGTASQLEVKQRFLELGQDIRQIVGQTGKNGAHQINNALIEIADDLRRCYRHFDQFVEEEVVLKKLRDYEWDLEYRSPRPDSDTKGLFHRIGCFLSGKTQKYFNLALSGFPVLICLSMGWVVLFAILYYVLDVVVHSEYKRPGLWVRHSALCFFGADSNVGEDVYEFEQGDWTLLCFWALSIVEIISGFLHIGIFISYLFQKISRR